MKVVTVVGARPQFIKASVTSMCFEAEGVQEIILHTGQHYDSNMSDVFFQELGIPSPLYNFEIRSQSHGEMTGKMLEMIERTLIKESPDLVLVFGDTNSTLAGGLAAAKLHIPVAHVEAGLRSFNRRMPEEINRVLVDHLSDVLFCPTKAAASNLRNEGVSADKTHVVGDVMYDVALHFGEIAKKKSSILSSLGLRKKNFTLFTCHRQENTNNLERFKAILFAMNQVSSQSRVVFPLHPRTKKYLSELGWLAELKNISFIDPLGYLDMVCLEAYASLIVTDSGGVQKEAYFHGVPCITLRDETEWVELVDAGWNRLVYPNSVEEVYSGVMSGFGMSGSRIEEYGDGRAAGKIVRNLIEMI